MTMIAALRIKLDNSHFVNLYVDGQHSIVDWKRSGEQNPLIESVCEYSYIPGSTEESGITVVKSLNEKATIRITETKRYRLKIEALAGAKVELPTFPNEGKYLKCFRDEGAMSFQFVNYLGLSKMKFCNPKCEVEFEVVPDKMNYEKDYIELTEAIARNCAALLLEHTGSTAMLFKHDTNPVNSVLEQFIFLRQFCYTDNLIPLFEAIKRNPDRVLEKEEVFKPIGIGKPAMKFYAHPFSYGKDWTRYTDALTGKTRFKPQRIAVTHKFDSVDTPANRLIKYAFECFDSICECLIKNSISLSSAECIEEAKSMHQMIDNILHDNFFDDVGELDIVPLNNQVLLKREGYSQIYAAFFMIDLALQLNWRGQEDIFEGESKDVSLLYEYWLFFELYNIVRSIQGCKAIKTDEKPFISENDGLTLSLRQADESCQAFELVKQGVRLNLYYNKTFSGRKFVSTGYAGSYSRPFRPDYTLAVFPNSYADEKKAIKGGAVSYIHFDAKYRVEKIQELIGEINNASSDKELKEEKREAITNTYKRGDLLKMHTYNDAIRRTVGSYVLFPGSAGGKKTFELYDELLPGVGAFAIRPSIQKQSEKTIRQFILDLIQARTQKSTRLGRLDQYKEMVVREPRTKKSKILSVSQENRCIIGYLRSQKETDYYNYLVENRILETGKEFIFYFYAIKDGNVYSHHKDVFNTQYIRFYKNDIQSSKTYELEPFLCIVKANELVSKEDLVKQLKNLGYNTSIEQHYADYYYVLHVEVNDVSVPHKRLTIDEVNNKNGNDTYSPHSPKVLLADCF